MRPVSHLVVASTLVVGCSNDFAKSKMVSVRQNSAAVAITTDEDGNTSGDFSSISNRSQILSVGSGQIAGSSIAVPPGTLSIPVSLIVGPGTDLTTPAMVDTLGLSSNPPGAAGPAVAFVPSQPVEVTSPFVLSIPFARSGSLSLNEFIFGDSTKYRVLYRGVKTVNGVTQHLSGVMPRSAFQILEDSVEVTTTILGTYQVVKFAENIDRTIQKVADVKPLLKSQVLALTTVPYLSANMVYTVGTAATENKPVLSTNDFVSGFTIAPALPLGLVFNPGTGVISGSPTVVQPMQTYTVTASNDISNVSTALTLTVNSATPTDTIPPTVTMTSTTPTTTNVSPIPVTVTFSESVTGVALGDFVISNGVASNLAGSAATYTFDVTPSGSGTVTIDLAAGMAIDAAGNGNTAASQLSRVYNNLSPSVVLSTGVGSHTLAPAITVTATFSDSVTGFVVGDITTTNATVSGFSGSGTTYTFTLTASSQGAFSAAVNAGVAQDASLNTNTASNTLTVTYDNVAPTVLITSGSSATTNVNPIPITITFSESVTGFVVGDISVTGGSAGALSGSGSTYTAEITPSGQGVINVNVAGSVAQDTAGNNNTAATQLSRTFDSVTPTVTITSSASSVTNSNPIPVTVTFSESVTGFLVGDVTLSGGTASNFSGSGLTYTFDFTPVGEGTKTINISANVAQDGAGNNNTAATQLSRTFDSVAPTVTLSSTAPNQTNTSPIPVTITFSEAVTGFAVGDLVVTGATAGSFSGSGTTYSASLTPSGNGTITLDVASGAGQDSAGNSNTATTPLTRVFDMTGPTTGGFSASTAVSASGFTLNWAAASDSVTSQTNLQYFVCSGASVTAIDTVNECEGATLELSYTSNQLTHTITGKTPNSTYFYNVIVRDAAGNKSIYNGISQLTSPDITAPSPGNSGNITLSSVALTSMTLNWTAATDNATAGTSLQYYVCSGNSISAIDTVAECESATQVATWTANSTSRPVSGLTPSTTYYYNVIVRDAAMNKSIYSGVVQATLADTTAPIPGTNQDPTEVRASWITLNWSAGSDNITAVGSLQYRTCMSATSDSAINTVAACEAATSVMTWTPAALTTSATGLAANTTYYFRTIVKDAADNKALYPGQSITTALTTDTDIPRDSSSQHTFYDSVHDRHWVFYVDGGFLRYRHSTDKKTWASGPALDAPSEKFVMHYKDVSAVPYVFMVSEDNFDIVLRRGQLTSSNVTFESPVTVFDGTSVTDEFKNPTVVTDDTNVWVAASKKTGSLWQVVVRESANAADGDLAIWQTESNLGKLSVNLKSITLLPKGGADLYGIYKDGEAVIGHTLTSGTWSSAHTGGDYSWLTLSEANGTIKTAVMSGNDLYVGGQFTSIGGVVANNIARWNGTQWSGLLSGVNGGVNPAVNALAVSGSDLYVGGTFINAGGSTANNVARWSGSSWSPLVVNANIGVNGTVNALAVSGSDLYTGGAFISAGGINTGVVARWDGSSWSALGSGLGGGSVNALAVSGSNLFVGGSFNTAGGSTANRVACWNGSSWSALSTGMNNTVNALVVSGSDLYAGGTFTSAGGILNTSGVARWSGTSWSALGSGIGGSVNALAVSGSDLYVGGDFTNSTATLPAVNIARWNSSSWFPVGASISSPVKALAVHSSILQQVFSVSNNSSPLIRKVEELVPSVTNARAAQPFSAAVNNSGDLTLAYIDHSSGTNLLAKSYVSGNWSADSTIRGPYALMNPQISSVPGTNHFVAFWYEGAAYKYRRFDGTSWFGTPPTLISGSLASRHASCDPFAGDSIIKCIATSGSVSPFEITTWSVTP